MPELTITLYSKKTPWKPLKNGLMELISSTEKTLFSAIFRCRLPNFFPRGWGGGCSHFWGPKAPKIVVPRAEGARFTKSFENLKNFEKILLKNAIKLILGDFLRKFF